MQIPLSPRRDDPQVRAQRGVRQLEADLVIPLPCAPMGDRVCADHASHFHLTATENRSGHGRPQKVFPAIDGPDLQRRKDEVLDEFPAQILTVERRRPGAEGFLLQAVEPSRLSDVPCHAYDIGPVRVLEPRHNHGGVEPSRVAENDLHRFLRRHLTGAFDAGVKKEARGSEARSRPANAPGGLVPLTSAPGPLSVSSGSSCRRRA